MNSLERQRLYQDYKEMKQSYQNVVEANTKLVNENQYLTLDKEILQHKIDKAIEYMNDTIDFSWKNNSPIKNGKSLSLNKLLDILKGSDEDGFYN